MNKKNVVSSTRNLQLRQDKGYACVYLNGKKIMLGARFGTPEADEAFRQLQIKVLTDPTLTSLKPQQITVDDLCAAYLLHSFFQNRTDAQNRHWTDINVWFFGYKNLIR